jgi:hypothetical protein
VHRDTQYTRRYRTSKAFHDAARQVDTWSTSAKLPRTLGAKGRARTDEQVHSQSSEPVREELRNAMHLYEVKTIVPLWKRNVGTGGCAETLSGRDAPSAGPL